MNDRELLERAARAAGVTHPDVLERHLKDWNPLEDDGDALRLAVNLGLTVGMHRNRIIIQLDALDEEGEEVEIDEVYRDIFKGEEWESSNAQRATRRAITRAAAALADNA